jgi:large subunit ribosomal protein L24
MARISTKPREQRKLLYTAHTHQRRKMLAAMLSPELRDKYNTRSLPVRKNDTAKILRGDFTGVEGKVTRVDYKNYRLFLEGVTKEKTDGTPVQVPIHPSKVMITKLDLSDKLRKETIEKVAETPEAPAPTKEPEKPSEEKELKEA